MSRQGIRVVWKLSRRHTWGQPIPEEELIRIATKHEDHDEMRQVLHEEVLALPFVERNGDGIFIPNGQGAHIEAADWLREHSDIDELKIAATLSRLPDDWPQN